jgi:hypothetical protein
MERGIAVPLSADEEVTVRRIVLGIVPPDALRADHVNRLIRLNLVEERDGLLALTDTGKEPYHALPRAAEVSIADAREFAAVLNRQLRRGIPKPEGAECLHCMLPRVDPLTALCWLLREGQSNLDSYDGNQRLFSGRRRIALWRARVPRTFSKASLRRTPGSTMTPASPPMTSAPSSGLGEASARNSGMAASSST